VAEAAEAGDTAFGQSTHVQKSHPEKALSPPDREHLAKFPSPGGESQGEGQQFNTLSKWIPVSHVCGGPPTAGTFAFIPRCPLLSVTLRTETVRGPFPALKARRIPSPGGEG